MRREPPAWWSPDRPQTAARLLAPLGWLYGAAGLLRWRLTRPYRSSLPVICIGNLTAGGAGKTPVALMLGGLLQSMGRRPGFLSRGYGGRLRGPHPVDARRDLATAVGDEPLLLARQAPTVIARERPAGARLLEGMPIDVIVMDDGLQNPALARDLAIAVVDARQGTGNGRLVPAGPLRLPLAFQLARTDAVLLLAGPGDAPSLPRLPGFTGPVLHAVTRPGEEAARLAGVPVVAFAGIGRPDKLFATLEHVGARLCERVPFPDHHVFTPGEADLLLAAARRHRARLVTTSKDAARLAGSSGALAELAAAAWVLPIGVHMSGGDGERLAGLVAGALARRAGPG